MTLKQKPATADDTDLRAPSSRGPQADTRCIAVYARCASEDGRRDGINRQIKAAEDHSKASGGRIVATFVDRTRADAPLLARDGLCRMLAEARTGAFGLVVVEDVDRIARDPETLALVFDRLHRSRIAIHLAGRGPIDRTAIILRGSLTFARQRLRRAMWRRPR